METMQGLARADSTGRSGWRELQLAPTMALERAVRLEAPLDEAFLTIADAQEQQARTAAALLERESWALTALLARSTPIWQQAARSTLRFEMSRPGDPAPARLELGCFAHLAALLAPTAQEQELVAASTPTWARVAPHPGRQEAGYTGALAFAYTPIATANAVSLLGFGRILAQLEAATRAASQALSEEARAQAERRTALVTVERMLHVAPDADEEGGQHQIGLPVRWLLMFRDTNRRTRQLLVGGYLVCLVLLCCALVAAF